MSLPNTVGDTSDFLSRLKGVLPRRWFGSGSTPVVDGVLTAPAAGFADNYSMLAYVYGQIRIKTSSGPFLDLISQDYFGGKLPRYPNETDANFLARITANLLIGGPTRANLIAVLEVITGRTPLIVEPGRPQDCGGWDIPTVAWDTAGHWGDILPYQAFVEAYRPLGSGIPNVAGWDISTGAWDTPSELEWTDASQTTDVVSDDTIYEAIAANKPEGTILWARIASAPLYP